MTVLTFVGYYPPACKAGGPIRSIANLVECLGHEFDFRVVTPDRDAGDTGPFEGIVRRGCPETAKPEHMGRRRCRRRLPSAVHRCAPARTRRPAALRIHWPDPSAQV